jgi:mRNA-degrading endonuclease toxin of MazEF toxin-antitoxin module
MMPLTRGEVVWAKPQKAGVPLKKRRPAVVVQNDIANRFAPHTILVPIREDAGKKLPVQVQVPAGVAGLTKNSVVDCGFPFTIPTAAVERTGKVLPPAIMAEVNGALKRSLALS